MELQYCEIYQNLFHLYFKDAFHQPKREVEYHKNEEIQIFDKQPKQKIDFIQEIKPRKIESFALQNKSCENFL